MKTLRNIIVRCMKLALLPGAVLLEGSLLIVAWLLIGIHKLCECGFDLLNELAERLPNIQWYINKPEDK